MRRPTRPQRPALVASELIVHQAQGVCKPFFSYILAFLCVLPTVLRFCVVIVQCVCFLVCRCCPWCELNRRRRVSRFKRCLRLRLRCWLACVFAPVFAPLQRVKTPSAVAVAVCAVVYARARDSLYAQGGQGIESASVGGGVTSPYNSNK